MKKYTVFGFYEDNNQRAGFHVEAKNPDHAEKRAIKIASVDMGGDFVPVVVLGGYIQALDTENSSISREEK